jgi:YbgC/YbaW family acyl-CoA thioester hydrolase
MPYEFRATRRVEFHETDLAGIVHFSNFFRYMETVEGAFYRSFGQSVLLRGFQAPMGLPRVHADCDYLRPLRFEDVVEMHLLVKEKREKVLNLQIRFRRIEPGPVEEVAVGHVAAVCVQRGTDGSFRSVPYPEEFARNIEKAPPELLWPGRSA